MNKNFDDEIKNSLSQEIKIPDSILTKAELAFEQIRNSEEIKPVWFAAKKKQLIASVVAICVVGSVLFGNSALAAIRNFFTDTGIQKAVDNGYVQVLPENAVKNNGVVIKVDNIVADKTKMAISFTLNFDDANKLKKVNNIMMGLTIKDDKGRVVTEEGNINSMIGGFEPKTDISQKEKGELKYYLEMYSTAGKIIDVKNLLINVKSINLFKQNKVETIGKIRGDWNFLLNLDDKFTTKQEVKYKAENSHDMVKLVSAEMLPTGMSISFIMNKPVGESIISKVTLVDEQGNIYRSSSNASMERTPDEKDLIAMTFGLTSFENKDKLKMIIKDIDGKDIELKLIKNTSNN